jgi:AcrR family transcriptional regulator
MTSLDSTKTLTANQQSRRLRILHAARDLIADYGYDGMIMRDVATAANVSPTTLYNLYNTKDELLLAALRESASEGWNRASEEVAEIGFERIIVQLHHSVEQAREEPAYANAITHALMRANKGDQLATVLLNGVQRGVTASLVAMQERKQLKEGVDADKLAWALVGVYWSNFMLWSKGLASIEDLDRELKRAYLSYLLPVVQGRIKKEIQNQLDAVSRI